MKQPNTNPSWIDIDKACATIALKLVTNKCENVPYTIVGLTRGGLIPATIISHMLERVDKENVVIPVSYSSREGKGERKGYSNVLPALLSQHVLIVDDIADSGNSMKEVSEGYRQAGHFVQTAVLYYKESSLIIPTYYYEKIAESSPWIVFPWE